MSRDSFTLMADGPTLIEMARLSPATSLRTTLLRWLGRLVPERLRPAPDPHKRHFDDIQIALLYYSLNLYIADTEAGLSRTLRELAESNPQRELYSNLLGTAPTVPWIIHSMLLRQLAQIESRREAERFFSGGGDFSAVTQRLSTGYRCELRPTDADFGPLQFTPPPTLATLSDRVHALPTRLEGNFPHGNRLRRLLASSEAEALVQPFVTEIVRLEGVQPAEHIPYLSGFFALTSGDKPGLDGHTPVEAFFRVVTEQWLFGEHRSWEQVTGSRFDQAFQSASQATVVFDAVSQGSLVTGIRKDPASLFRFMQQFQKLLIMPRERLYRLAAARDSGKAQRQWRKLTQSD